MSLNLPGTSGITRRWLAIEPKTLQGPAVTAEKLRSWGVKSALSLLDQALTSVAGFGVNVLLARWMPAVSYGAFAVAFSAYLFFSGFHNVLLLEPLSVIGPARYAARLESYFRAQLKVHGVLVWPLCSAIMVAGIVLWRLAPHNPLVGAIIGSGMALPVLLLLWLTRRLCYIVQRPSVAVLGSALYCLFCLAALIMLWRLHFLTDFRAFLVMGAGSFLGSYVILARLGCLRHRSFSESGIVWSKVLAENWNYGRWLVGSAVLYSASSQAQTFLVAALLGLGAAGALRAMQIPSLVMTQVITAAGLLVLPTLSFDFGRGRTDSLRRKSMIVSIGLATMAILFAGALVPAATRLDLLLFAGKYSTYAWLMPVLALVPVVSAASMGYSMSLRASQKPQYDLVANAISAPVAVLSAYLLMHWWGLAGAAVSMVLSFTVMSVVIFICFTYDARRGHSPAI